MTKVFAWCFLSAFFLLLLPSCLPKRVPVTPQNTTSSPIEETLERAQHALKADPVEARRMIKSLLDSPQITEKGKTWERIVFALSEVNRRILFSDVPSPDKDIYVVKHGDSLDSIAKRFGTSPELIHISNGLDRNNPSLRPGQTLRIWRGYWNIEIRLSQRLLILKELDQVCMVYRVGIGKKGNTPTGKFLIDHKVKNPAWYYKGKKYPSGHPDNPLGSRWMSLKGIERGTHTKVGYGIHGTHSPKSVKTFSGNGCIVMGNPQVEELFSILPQTGTPVMIVP